MVNRSVRIRCWVGERGLLASIVSDVAVLSQFQYPTLIFSKYGINPSDHYAHYACLTYNEQVSLIQSHPGNRSLS